MCALCYMTMRIVDSEQVSRCFVHRIKRHALEALVSVGDTPSSCLLQPRQQSGQCTRPVYRPQVHRRQRQRDQGSEVGRQAERVGQRGPPAAGDLHHWSTCTLQR